jgi:hypothetical protein
MSETSTTTLQQFRQLSSRGDDDISTTTTTTLQLMMRLEPRAAWFADNTGKYPLHYALANPTIASHVVHELLTLSPVEALVTVDPTTGLLPFQLAALQTKPSSLIYSLLRAEPSAGGATRNATTAAAAASVMTG